MPFVNHTPFPAELFEQINQRGTVNGVVSVRGTFSIWPETTLTLDCRQVPFVWSDTYVGDPLTTPLLAAGDLAPFKPGTDVTLLGSSFAPDGRPLPHWICGITIDGRLDKRLQVTGPRQWLPRRARTGRRDEAYWSLSEPEPVRETPLCWTQAYGGARPAAGEAAAQSHPDNPLGVGWSLPDLPPEALPLPAPRIEDPNDPITDWRRADYAPQGFAPIPPWWEVRRRHMGTIDDAWLETRHPLLAETVTGPDGAEQAARFAYDRAGQLAEAHNAWARVELERDRLGRVVAETVNGRRVASAYDCCGNRVARHGLGAAVASAYDPLGALAELRIGAHAALQLHHDAAGRETHRESGGGFVLESGYDPAGRLIRQLGGRGALPGSRPGPALARVYAWNRASEPVSIADARWGPTGYRHDGNGQVSEARHGDGLAERFDYDAALNVAAFQEVGAGPGGLVQGASRERAGFRPLVWSYGWDGRDRLVRCRTPAGETWAYGYDAFGRRVWKRRADAAAGAAYGWDGDLLSAEAPLRADGSAEWGSATVWHYEPGTFRPLAREGADGSLLYVVTDRGHPHRLYRKRLRTQAWRQATLDQLHHRPRSRPAGRRAESDSEAGCALPPGSRALSRWRLSS